MSRRVIARLALLAAVVPVGIAWSAEVGGGGGAGVRQRDHERAPPQGAPGGREPEDHVPDRLVRCGGRRQDEAERPAEHRRDRRPVGIDPEARKATDVRFDGFREAALRSAKGLFPRGSPPLGPVVCGRTEPQP
ncbi:MAG TPA: hypothetical protein VHG51_04800, partial [Longimicrobiaceae bacterium]|nr:hypothetical protein [Longimicrobiaceae bacterium]